MEDLADFNIYELYEAKSFCHIKIDEVESCTILASPSCRGCEKHIRNPLW